MLLKGVRAIEWADTMSAAFCGRLLADLGAEIVKIEQPGAGDPLRRAGPFLPGAPYGDDGALFAYANHGKRAITLDPSQPTGTVLLGRLLEEASLLICSRPAEELERLGLHPASLRRRYPALVILTISPFGHGEAPRAMTNLTLTHHAGYAFHQARPAQWPDRQPPVGGADHEMAFATGVAAAGAAISAVIEAEREGAGQHVDCANADVIAHLLIEPMADFNRGERHFSRLREKLSGTEVAGGLIWLLPCEDGFVMISPREQHQWDRWVELLGNPAWAADGTLCATREQRTENWAVLQEHMAAWTRGHTRGEIFRRTQVARVACFPVSTPRDLLDNEQLHARAFFDRLPLETGTDLPMPGLPFAIRTSGGAALPKARRLQRPRLGQDNAAILQEGLNIPPATLETLRRAGIV